MLMKFDKFVPLKGKDDVTVMLTAKRSDVSELARMMMSDGEVDLTIAAENKRIQPEYATRLNNMEALLSNLLLEFGKLRAGEASETLASVGALFDVKKESDGIKQAEVLDDEN